MKTVVVILGVVGMLVALNPGAAQQSVAAASATSLKPAPPQRVVNLKTGSFVIDTLASARETVSRGQPQKRLVRHRHPRNLGLEP